MRGRIGRFLFAAEYTLAEKRDAHIASNRNWRAAGASICIALLSLVPGVLVEEVAA